jgi:succinate-semialdehyde dehydrogenase/glutarate-semialdehyde dehydrogenase
LTLAQGELVTALTDVSNRVYRTVNPATGEVVREYAALSDVEAEALLARAHAAFPGWRDTPVAQRASLFRRFIELYEKNVEEFARLATLEMGKPIGQSRMEAAIVAQMFGYYAEHGERLLADEQVSVPGFTRAITRREAVGVVLGIEPWNGPLFQAMRATVPNLMLGNTVLLKPSEIAAGSTEFFDHLFLEAGFPADVYQTALVSAAQVSTYIADPRLRAITLTGSDRAGAAVAEQAGRHIKPVVLELGGSDPYIVLASANIPAAVGTAAICRLLIGGQMCNSPKRIILEEAIAESFVEQFVAQFAAQKLGDGFDPETTVGPLSSNAAVELLQAQYQDALDKGARVLLPGGRLDGPGAFFRPAVLTGITPAMRLYHEEAFGPIGMIYVVPDAEAAIELANDTKYGLAATVFGAPDEAEKVARRLDAGSVGINSFLGGPVEIPFGGTKASGFGREFGRSGMDQFANIKTYGIA